MTRGTDRRTVPEAVWKEEDVLEGRRVRALVVILRTVGCWWSRKRGCLMCGYNQAASEEGVGSEHLLRQLEAALAKFDGEEMVKIYTSGSFLDEREVPLEARERILEAFSSCRRMLFESRPEFVTPESLSRLPPGRAELALGLESASDDVLQRCIEKGFRVADYQRAASLARSQGIAVRTYVLLKPPFMTERAALEDALASVAFASPFSESVSVNPVNVQKHTLVESLFRRGDYRPPWLWSLVEVLRGGGRTPGARVFSSPSGAGTARGAHNCGGCDAAVMAAVERFAFSQDVTEFDGLDCSCRGLWRAQLELQDAMRTSVDLERHLAGDLALD